MRWPAELIELFNNNRDRVTQLVSRGVYVVMSYVLGRITVAPPDADSTIKDNADLIAAGIVGVLAVALDLWLHRKKRGGIIADDPTAVALRHLGKLGDFEIVDDPDSDSDSDAHTVKLTKYEQKTRKKNILKEKS